MFRERLRRSHPLHTDALFLQCPRHHLPLPHVEHVRAIWTSPATGHSSLHASTAWRLLSAPSDATSWQAAGERPSQSPKGDIRGFPRPRTAASSLHDGRARIASRFDPLASLAGWTEAWLRTCPLIPVSQCNEHTTPSLQPDRCITSLQLCSFACFKRTSLIKVQARSSVFPKFLRGQADRFFLGIHHPS